MSAFTPSFVKRVVKKIFPSLRKTHIENLSLGIVGQIKSQSGLMSEIVRFVPGAVKHKHRLKRFWRFLSNPKIKPEYLTEFWVTWCVRTFCPEGIKVAMDWTTLPGDIQCLMIAIPVHGRAIPLLWQLIRYSDIKDSQNMIEERLVAKLVNLIAENFPDKKLLLTADRGFGRATLFQFLLKKKVLFVIRVKGDVQIKTNKGKTIMLRKLGKKLIPGKAVWYENISYRSDGKVTDVNLAAVVAPPEEVKEIDPWFLITNLKNKEETIKRYEERFHIEEWFKDMKHQLGVAQIQTKNLKRVRRLLFLAVVSSGILMVVGNVADSLTTVKDTLITGRNKAASRIWFAVKFIQHELAGRSFFAKVYAVIAGS